MSKIHYVVGKHMTSCKCVTYLGVTLPYCLVSMPKMREKQRSSINYVFETDIIRKKSVHVDSK